jgi:lysozyme family protein
MNFLSKLFELLSRAKVPETVVLKPEGIGFDSAFIKTVGLEGGYGNDPNDSGNWTGGKIGIGELKGTKYGISATSFPNEDIKNLSLDRAKTLYRVNYWDVLNLDKINNKRIQEEIFDTSVNMGTGGAGMIVQRAINFLEPGPEDSPLEIDGDIGSVTLSYINKWDNKDAEALFRALNGFQFMRYVEISKADSVKKRFNWGWMKRIQDYKEV